MRIPTPRPRANSVEALIVLVLAVVAALVLHRAWLYLPDLIDHLARARSVSIHLFGLELRDMFRNQGDPS